MTLTLARQDGRLTKTLFGGNPASPGADSAAGVAKPGDVACLLGGRYELDQTFCPPNSSTTWITYQALGDGDVDFVWTAGVTAAQANGTLTDVASIGFLQPMIRVGSGGYCGGSSKYLKFIGLNLDGGQNNALEGFFLLCLRPCAVYRQYRPQYRRIGHRRRWLRLFGQRS